MTFPDWRSGEGPPPLHQFMMQFLLRVMKYTWLLPPDRTEAKNTWRDNGHTNTHKLMNTSAWIEDGCSGA